MEGLDELAEKAIDKKELKTVDKEFAESAIRRVISQNPELYEEAKAKRFNERSREYKALLKEIRRKMRELYGSFSKTKITKEKKEKIIQQIKEGDEKALKAILSSHFSTYERLPYYEEIYRDIVGKTNSIMDLGCGYNPFSYKYLEGNPKYYACDISYEDVKLIQKYFDLENIKGISEKRDLTKKEDLEEIHKKSKDYETCFLFKIMDTLEGLKWDASKHLLQGLECEKLIISVAVKALGGRVEIKSKRPWLERFISELEGFDREDIVIGTEKYIILKKSS